MSTIKVNTIETRTGSTLTLGKSGDTVSIASGASTSGMGRTGTVDWQTTKKTTSFTAEDGKGYFVDTAASGAVTMTLPSSPSAGAIVGVKDYNGNFGTANLTIGRGGSPINGFNNLDVTISTDGASIMLVYVDSSQGWVATNDDESTFTGENFIVATGGTITTVGSDKVHTFTSPGTFTVCSVSAVATNNRVSYMVVAGGGGSGGDSGGGGGAGGFREDKSPVTPYTASPLVGAGSVTVTATGFPVVVGAGGSGGSGAPPSGSPGAGSQGSTSSVFSISSAGGGIGGNRPSANGGNGGSGGGARSESNSAGSGNTPPVSPPQGNDGGGASPTPTANSAGGGGATALGAYAPASGVSSDGGPGGAGATTQINGASTTFAGGGGGGGGGGSPTSGGPGGAGGGGNGADGGSGTAGGNGTANTGGGGAGGNDDAAGGSGGSGIVIIRYKAS